ncbi:NAD-dependent epimerase/dehydratase [bacterium]|nr:NAD-dependent epimerase/dehydratase [bacterium]|tara:strand:- start:9342 stop:10211 length:870 start_codon:yes stop_codon:yes gene_type:complete
MNILVTGATGFIGRHLTSQLISDGHDVSALVRPDSDTSAVPQKVRIIDSANVETIFKENDFDGIIHLATFFTPAHTNENLHELIESNITFGTKLLDASTKANLSWFINTGTFSQYGEDGSYSPANLYSATKQAFADVVKHYSLASKTNILTLILFNTFGPNDPRTKIFTLWKSAMDSGDMVDMSLGEQVIDITHIDNIIDGYRRAVELLEKDSDRKLNGRIFSLPSQERMTLKELATLFAEVLGKPLPVTFGATPYRNNEIMNPIQGTILPGWKQNMSLREGIKRTFVD